MSPPSITPILARPPARPAWAWVMLALVFAAHSYQATRLFPNVRSIYDRESPVLVVDHAIHEYHGSLGAGFVREGGTSWGYDPYFMAGYPETPVWDSSSNPSILFDLIGGARAGDYRAYKVGLWLTSILALAAVSAGGWAAGLGVGEVAWATLFAWLYFWLGFPITLWRSGLFAFLAAAMGVGLLFGLCVRFDRSPGRLGWILLAAAGAGLFFVHVTAPILAGGGALAFTLGVMRRHGWRWHLAVVGAAALAVLVNLPWLASLWRFRSIRTGSGMFMTSDSARFLYDYYTSASLDGRVGLALIVLGSLGLVLWLIRGRRAEAAAFGGSIAALILLTGFGSLWGPTRTLEPLRFRVAFCFLLCIPAGSCVVTTGRWVAQQVGGRRGLAVALLAWGIALGVWVRLDALFFRVAGITLIRERPLVVGFEPEMRRLARWIKENTDLSARILLEDQLRLYELTDPESVHWTPLLPDLIGRDDPRMFIGGLYQTAFIRHHDLAAFGDFQLGDRRIDRYTSDQIKSYLDRYNVGWVVAWSPASRACFDRLPMATRLGELPRYATPGLKPTEERYAIYRLERPRTYFLKGSGRVVSVGPNRVELADVTPDAAGVAVLSLHWLDTWRSDPPATLGPEPAAPDPVDFVRIEAKGPIPRLVLSNGYTRNQP